MKNHSVESTGIIKSSELDQMIKDVKIQIRKIFQGYKELIQRLGSFLLEKELVKKEDICSEIKNALRDEIKEKLVSSDTIERSCPDEWKRKTRPIVNEDPQMRIFEGKNELEQVQETVTSTNISVTPEGQILQHEFEAANAMVAEERTNQKEEQFGKIEQQREQTIKAQEKELEKLHLLAEQQQAQRAQLIQENVDLKDQLGRLQEENTRLRAGLDETKKEGRLKILVDEWTLSNQLSGLRYSKYTKLQIIIESRKFVKIEGVD